MVSNDDRELTDEQRRRMERADRTWKTQRDADAAAKTPGKGTGTSGSAQAPPAKAPFKNKKDK